MITIDYNGEDGIIRMRSSGFLTVEEADRSNKELHVAAARSRRDWGDVRLFIDSIECQIASAEVIEAFAKHKFVIVGGNDRMVVVLASSLGKMQASRNFRSEREKAFISADAAMMWLMAEPRTRQPENAAA